MKVQEESPKEMAKNKNNKVQNKEQNNQSSPHKSGDLTPRPLCILLGSSLSGLGFFHATWASVFSPVNQRGRIRAFPAFLPAPVSMYLVCSRPSLPLSQ